MVTFIPARHAGHLMEAGDAGVVCLTEEPSIHIPVQWFISSPLDVFLALEPRCFPKGHSVAVSNCMHCFHLILCVLHPGIWPKALPFVVVVFLFVAELLPPCSQYVTSFPKSNLSWGKMCSSQCRVTAKSLLAGKAVCIYVPRSQLPNLAFFLSALQ